MPQSITLKIAGKEYPLLAADAEQERLMRLSAEEINKMLARYDAKYLDTPLPDKLVFVALNETVARFSALSQLQNASAEANALNVDIENYLKTI